MHAKLITTWFTSSVAALIAAQAGLAQTSLSVGDMPGYPGATVSVPVTLRPVSNTVAAQFDVGFNAGKVSALAAVRGPLLTNHVIRSRQVAPGVERVLVYSLGNAPMAGTNATVASLPFTLSPSEARRARHNRSKRCYSRKGRTARAISSEQTGAGVYGYIRRSLCR